MEFNEEVVVVVCEQLFRIVFTVILGWGRHEASRKQAIPRNDPAKVATSHFGKVTKGLRLPFLRERER